MKVNCIYCNLELNLPIGSPTETHTYMWHYMTIHILSFKEATNQALTDKMKLMNL